MKIRSLASLATLAALTVFAGCGDDPISVDDRDPPVRVVVESLGLTLATATEFTTLSTPLLVAVGVAVPHEIRFLDETDTPYEPAADQFLEVTFADAGVARWETDTDGAFDGDYRGLAEGTTTVRYRLMRGTPGSADATEVFSAFPIPVSVVP